ncbi:DUF551 domain-containing protein [Escherichia coli]|uniref:DUF551 domain-containing protein n=1 Tax=Escherichia coli TaxID=562 RepID=UPI002275FB4C|nr:DUF551 domain-containing protein [Escherichia coli]
MSTITKERIELFIKSPLENGLTRGEQMELARIALASLEAKPIGAFHIAEQQVDGTSDYLKDGEWPIDNGIIEVYAAPPVPVVPEEKPMPNPLKMYAVDAVAAIAEVRGWNACRAAMLQGVEPASNHEELPLDYLQGQKDGLEWAAQLAEANHPQTGDWLYDDPLELAKAIRKGPDMPEFDGPTPVTPDGWISCSEQMPDDGQHVIILCDGAFVLYAQYRDGEFFDVVRNGEEFFETQSRNVTDWMPLPEPPQEAK